MRKKNTFNRDEYLKASEYAVSSCQTTVKERMPQPTEDSDDETSKNIPADENANTKDKVDAVSKYQFVIVPRIVV